MHRLACEYGFRTTWTLIRPFSRYYTPDAALGVLGIAIPTGNQVGMENSLH